jgi:hypothetical protein
MTARDRITRGYRPDFDIDAADGHQGRDGDTPACCNPDHLAETTNGANIMPSVPAATAEANTAATRW